MSHTIKKRGYLAAQNLPFRSSYNLYENLNEAIYKYINKGSYLENIIILLPECLLKMNFDNCCIAGGSVSRMVFRSDDWKEADYDIFIYRLPGVDEFNMKLRELILHFAAYNSPTILMFSYCTRIKIQKLVIDIVHMAFPGVTDILNNFDLAPSMFALVRDVNPIYSELSSENVSVVSSGLKIVTNDIGLECYNSGGCFRNRLEHFSNRYIPRISKYVSRGFTYIYDDMPVEIVFEKNKGFDGKYLMINKTYVTDQDYQNEIEEKYSGELIRATESLATLLESENIITIGLSDIIIYKRYESNKHLYIFPELEKQKLDEFKEKYQKNYESRIPKSIVWRVCTGDNVVFERSPMTPELFYSE